MGQWPPLNHRRFALEETFLPLLFASTSDTTSYRRIGLCLTCSTAGEVPPFPPYQIEILRLLLASLCGPRRDIRLVHRIRASDPELPGT